ncbi:MAG: PadR family transcriptional regulator [Bacteroidales bacterium]|nr:PadR family transcriptional regulator [Bacteroidales bacterium]MCB8999880.1 PadR family transcriptional regulator [Bacteroidales bacterium]
MISQELLKGSIRTIVLKLLSDHGRLYGYDLTKKVEELSEGRVKLSWGALYPSLHKLEADGLIVSEEVKIGKRVRRYYSLSQEGRDSTLLRLDDFVEYIQTMKSILSLKPDFTV